MQSPAVEVYDHNYSDKITNYGMVVPTEKDTRCKEQPLFHKVAGASTSHNDRCAVLY